MELLKNTLLKWDGRHVDLLIDVYDSKIQDPSFINDIIELYSTNNELEHATSWIIKYHIDNGKTLKQAQIGKLFQKIAQLSYWESQLHLLQLIPKLTLTKHHVASIAPHVLELLESEKKFVKAAAYEAYFEIVNFFPELSSEFHAACEEALTKESASVKVKIKRILNQLTKES